MKPEQNSIDMISVGAGQTLDPPALTKACVIRADIGSAIEFKTSEGYVRAYFPIVGGEVLGKGWKGRIVPGGADFAVALADGSYAIEARYMLEMEDGTPVMVTNIGKMFPQPDGTYHGRTRASLEVPDGPHAALGKAVYFGTALAEANDQDHVYIELWQAVL
ncbi:DUF3237 family protein [Rhizobium sp. AQ_MP]|uniref:DUF3237 domain-containing protein n=1 Tax=Rhizobium sp. AQ_MP TaxID=2761536 RepID=UPI00163AB8A8|nr:DUF3237 domain-containing protein [Rhizobium sp. AQ_MP]MBC2771858.1 DUF3237 family protein [Rhizobium sp. AQ_MP]